MYNGIADIITYISLEGTKAYTQDLNKVEKSAGKSATVIQGGLNAALAGTVAALGYSITAATKFEKQMANVNTLLDESAQVHFAGMNEQILQLASDVPQMMGALTTGLYDIVSAGAPAEAAVDMLRLAAEAATAGVSSAEVAVRAGMATLNAYGLAQGDAAETTMNLQKIYDLQFSTVKKGVITYEQLAGAIGTVLPAANNLNVSLEEMYGSIAFLTKSGQSAEMATTNLAQAFSAFVEKGDKLKELGVNVFDTTGAFAGMESIIGELSGVVSGMTDETKQLTLANVGFNVRAGRAINSMINNYDAFVETMDSVADSAGSMGDAFDIQMDTLQSQWDALLSTLEVTAITLGNEFLPVIKDWLTAINKDPQAIKDFVTNMVKFVAVLGTLGALSHTVQFITNLTFAFKALGGAAKGALGPVGLLVGTAVTVVKANEKLSESSLENATSLEELNEAYGKSYAAQKNNYLLSLVGLDGTKKLTAEYEEQKKKLLENQGVHQDFVDTLADEIYAQDDLIIATEDSTTATDELTEADKRAVEAAKLLEEKTKILKSTGISTTKMLEDQVFALEKQKALFEGDAQAVKEFDDKLKPLYTSVTSVTDNFGLWNRATTALIGDHVVLNATFVTSEQQINKVKNATAEAVPVVKDLNLEASEGKKDWADYAQFIQGVVDKLPGLDKNTKKVISTMGSMVTSGFDPMTVGLGLFGFAMDALGKNNEKVVISLDDLLDSMGDFGDEVERVRGLVDDLQSHIESDLVNTLENNLNQALEFTREALEGVENAGSDIERGMWQEYYKAGLDAVSEAQERLNELTAAFQMNTDFSQLLNELTYLSEEAINLNEYFGDAFNQSGVLELLNESLLEAKTNLSELDPDSQAFSDMANAIIEAEAAVMLLSGGVESQADALELLIQKQLAYIGTLEQGTPEYESAVAFLRLLGTELNEVNTANTTVITSTEDLTDATRLSGDQANSTESAWRDYGGTLNDIAYSDIWGAYDKEAQNTIGTNDDLSGSFDDITDSIKAFEIQWNDTFRLTFGQFDQYKKDIENAMAALAEFAKFNIDPNDSNVDEQIARLIHMINLFMGTLDPDSEAFKEMQAALAELVQQFIDVGGAIDLLPDGILIKVGLNVDWSQVSRLERMIEAMKHSQQIGGGAAPPPGSGSGGDRGEGFMPGFADGGYNPITRPVMLHEKEFVLTAPVVKDIGIDNLNRINKTGSSGIERGGNTSINIVTSDPQTYAEDVSDYTYQRGLYKDRKLTIKEGLYSRS